MHTDHSKCRGLNCFDELKLLDEQGYRMIMNYFSREFSSTFDILRIPIEGKIVSATSVKEQKALTDGK